MFTPNGNRSTPNSTTRTDSCTASAAGRSGRSGGDITIRPGRPVERIQVPDCGREYSAGYVEHAQAPRRLVNTLDAEAVGDRALGEMAVVAGLTGVVPPQA